MMAQLNPIVLVEDDPDDQEMVRRTFEKMNIANELVILNDGQEAIDYFGRTGTHAKRENFDPAVILLDIKMPKVDGLEVLRFLKGDDKLKLLPVVMLTSSEQEKDVMRS